MQREKDLDLQQWRTYKHTKSLEDRDALFQRMQPIVMKKVQTWAGPIPLDVLRNEAKALTFKAFDSYDPKKGTAISTHVTNSLAPLSRVVYTHQNTARLPENLILKVSSYNRAKEHLTAVNGYEPTSDQLHQELGWDRRELDRLEQYMRNDLTESAGGLDGSFYEDKGSEDDDLLEALYMSLLPNEKKLLEYTTGFHTGKKLSSTEICTKMGITQAQLSYQKTLLQNKLKTFMSGRR